ncbi:hypothetical protein MKX01_042918, partial [Papaver californicum]
CLWQRLPRKFVRIFGEELGNASLIEDPMGRIWPVEIRKAEGEIYFKSGWQEFMEYFSISVGYVLIFRYERDSHFHVSICDMSACEIDYPCRTKNVDESHPERVSAGEKHHSMENNQNMDVPFQHATSCAHTAANQAGPSCAANKRNQYEDYQVAGGSVKRCKSDGFEENSCKPWAFNFKRHPEVVTISSDGESDDENYQNSRNFVTLKDSTGKKWHVGVVKSLSSRNKADLYKGWYQFCLGQSFDG